MQLLVSDYDGTYSRGLKNIYLNNYYVNKWMQKGNKFMLSTGRSFLSIMEEIKKHNISYDYLSCLDGAAVFDKQNNLLTANYINHDIYDELKALTYSNPNINDFKVITPFDIMHIKAPAEQVLQYNIHLPSGHQDLDYLVQKTKQSLKNYIHDLDIYALDFGYDYDCFVTIRAAGICKTTGIKVVQDIHNLETDEIYAVGDGENDLDMIYTYNGYRIKGTLDYEHNVPIVKNVRNLVKTKIK